MSEIITINNGDYNENIINKIVDFLLNKKIIIMPSDTIYGFLCIRDCKDKLREIKNRDNKPFLFLIHSLTQLKKLDIDYIDYMDKKYILDKYWPGPFTFILKNDKKESLGIRLPDWDIIKNIIKLIDKPLLSTSVNFSGQEPLNNFDEIIKFFDNKADLIINDPVFKPVVSSAVIDLRNKPYKIIRKGSRDFYD